jgi:hypothetical protein
MREHELDHILSTDLEIRPSSRLARAVMDRVRLESTAPPPIAFPWMRALPAVVAIVLGVAWTALEASALRATHSAETVSPLAGWLDSLRSVASTAESAGIGWIFLSLILACVCWEFALRTVGRRT